MADMSGKPLVSIVCLCYNQSKFVVESLNGLKNQTYKNYEILIIDDHSQKDNSVEVIEQWILDNPQLNIRFIKHKQNKGICKSLNELLDLSKGKYLQLVALDDILLPWKLEEHVEILENSDEKDALVFTDAYLMDDNSILYQNRFIALHKKYLSLETGNYFEELIKGNFIPAVTVMFKADIIKNNGGWDSDLLYEDYDMWLGLSEKGFNFIFSDKPSCKYRLHDQNTHKDSNLFGVHTFKVFMKYSHHRSIQLILKEKLEMAYRSNIVVNENKLYFNKFPIERISDSFIKHNLPRRGFRVLRFFKL